MTHVLSYNLQAISRPAITVSVVLFPLFLVVLRVSVRQYCSFLRRNIPTLTNLSYFTVLLVMENCSLTGQLPTELGRLTNLRK